MRLLAGSITCSALSLLAIAPSSAQATKPAPAAASVALGSYECWAYSRPRMGLNFKVTGPGRYTNADGKAGVFTYNASTKAIVFTTGPLSNIMPDGFKAIYEVRQGKPTVSYIGTSGSEASFCEKV